MQNNRMIRNPFTGLALCLLLALFFLAYPLYVIRPFRYQGASELNAALSLMRFRPTVQVLLSASALALLVWAWRSRPGVWARASAVAGLLLVAGCGVLSRVNVYELMFKPLSGQSFSSAAESKLDGDEEVIAIRVGPAARAYPIRSMSYHHIVNDVLGNEPIVATY